MRGLATAIDTLGATIAALTDERDAWKQRAEETQAHLDALVAQTAAEAKTTPSNGQKPRAGVPFVVPEDLPIEEPAT